MQSKKFRLPMHGKPSLWFCQQLEAFLRSQSVQSDIIVWNSLASAANDAGRLRATCLKMSQIFKLSGGASREQLKSPATYARMMHLNTVRFLWLHHFVSFLWSQVATSPCPFEPGTSSQLVVFSEMPKSTSRSGSMQSMDLRPLTAVSFTTLAQR